MISRRGGGDPPWLSPQACALAEWILASHRHLFGRPLLAGSRHGAIGDDGATVSRSAAQELFAATICVLAHDGGEDPRLIYANRSALVLWGRRWGEMVGMPSRLTAAPGERPARRAMLTAALRQEAITGYGGVRVDRSGRRFRIEGARLWTVRDGAGAPCGQAAAFGRWWWLEPPAAVRRSVAVSPR